ncbi:MAG: SRPBCC family protein [Candidatus Marinimicrobia bacterium]|nr:SRPBCC family protein [Candidatus Neomarinimicrobiota bacterium]MCF7828584.1 SRPBCC family protein [Candidatus Neomarinimicrobiota bacterium]MCF7880325.1 SRPBCC family protein [Candidatus Neomarinimicrobiota bacterium]
MDETQVLPISLDVAWDFFSDPANLEEITPPWLKFSIQSHDEGEMYPGMLIRYKVTALFGIPMNWITEITQVREGEYFIDEQRFGPYRFWYHQHHFSEVENGTKIRDILHYGLPFGIIGRIVHAVKVKGQLREIFEYRHRILRERFGE